MATATKIRDLDGFTGKAALYKLDPPLALRDWDGEATGSTDYVIVSATVAFSGPETYIFPASNAESVRPSDWGKLHGSYQGGLDHAEALEGAGYEVAS